MTTGEMLEAVRADRNARSFRLQVLRDFFEEQLHCAEVFELIMEMEGPNWLHQHLRETGFFDLNLPVQDDRGQ
jgi:hypothetical protein